jgi:hypothetical protein
LPRQSETTTGAQTEIDAAKFPAQNRGMAKKAAAQNGRADLPVSQDARQRVPTK